MRRSPRAAVLVATLGLGALTACGDSTSSPTTPGGTATSSAAAGQDAGVNCTEAPTAKDRTPTLQLPDKKIAAGKTFTAKIETNCGTITADIYGDKAPQTVASFVALAKSYYQQTPCHRLTTAGIFVLQCGDPTGAGTGGPGYSFGVENTPADGSYPAGTLAMARGQSLDSNGGQFFFVYDDSTISPDSGGYSIFGKVTSGLSLLKVVAARGDDASSGSSGDGAPKQPIGIQKITVTEKKA